MSVFSISDVPPPKKEEAGVPEISLRRIFLRYAVGPVYAGHLVPTKQAVSVE